jgi:pimeloyl-ACP methyl ester carboxylesterase
MKITNKTVTLIFLLIGLCVIQTNAQESVEGYWAGESTLFGKPVFIQARFERTANGLGGFFNASEWNAAKRSMTNVRLDSSKLHFEFPSATTINFVGDGELSHGVIRGVMRRGDEQGDFHLVRVANVDPKILEDYVGEYTTESGTVNLVTWGAFGNLRFINLEEGYGDALLPLSETTFFFGRSVINSYKPDRSITFIRGKSGRVNGLSARIQANPANPEEFLPRSENYKQEQVKFNNGNVSLAGTLLTPATNLKHSAVILVHGSQDRSRDDSYEFIFANIYLRLGIAVLIFDKRGVGGSTGDWHYASFEDLAEDVLAGARYLKTRPDINHKQIGLRGVSQGGWVAPLAASRSKDIAFLVTISAAGVSPTLQVTHDQLRKARENGASEAELKEAAEFLRLQFEAVRSEKDWERFQSMIPAARGKSWYRFTLGGVPKESWLWEFTRLTTHFDPLPVWRKVKCPTLLVFGELDPNYPVSKSAAIMEKALKEGGNKDVTIKIFPEANHSLKVVRPDGKVTGVPLSEVESEWLIKRVNVNF